MEINKVIQGDCIEEIKKLPENSVDAIVTDPPYGLGFMGKAWDRYDPTVNKGSFKVGTGSHPRGYVDCDLNGLQQFCYEWANECLRVLKPGGFLLSFGGTRTYHRMVCGIEDAGFEIRDTIMWLYGSGFPKSHNIGKAIDKMQGNEREEFKTKNTRDRTKHNATTIFTGQEIKGWKDTKGLTEWEGFGTALKPAVEPIVVARKPLSERTVALNVLKWGTGGINIDATRIEGEPSGLKPYTRKVPQRKSQVMNYKKVTFTDNPQGRFPANIILDEEAGKMLDEQSGVSSSKKQIMGEGFNDSEVFGNGDLNYNSERGYNDKGGASRFFYCAKAGKKERNLGCDGMEYKKGVDIMASADWQKERGRNPENYKGNKNNHPTVKPIKLIEYLIKLVSKEGDTVLDPFLGSGTTAIAALKLNRKFIGIEKEEDYIKIIKARIKPFIPKEIKK